jgi:hypothetical protein
MIEWKNIRIWSVISEAWYATVRIDNCLQIIIV